MRLTLRFLLSAAFLAALSGRAVAAGMPQLHFQDPLLQGQVIWGAIIFIGFYLILSRSLLPRMATVLRQRQERIENDLDLARKTRDNANRAHAECNAARKKAAQQAHATIQSIREKAKADAAAHKATIMQRLEAEFSAAENRITAMREQTLTHLEDIATATASSLTERLLEQHDHDVVARAVKQARH